jgi:hypothetical protein
MQSRRGDPREAFQAAQQREVAMLHQQQAQQQAAAQQAAYTQLQAAQQAAPQRDPFAASQGVPLATSPQQASTPYHSTGAGQCSPSKLPW